MDSQASSFRGDRMAVTRMIVNADDFGYFEAVSHGIVDAIECGSVTATGVMANGPALERVAPLLRAQPGASVGVHLNASLGEPLTAPMRTAVGGRFPTKGAMGLALITGRIHMRVLLSEWRAQIARCADLGLAPVFVNSHEHLHVMPGLYSEVRALATEFGIRHVRAPNPEWGPAWSVAAAARNAVFVVARAAARRTSATEPELVGVAPSGRLDLGYCGWRFARLRRGGVYELMCHPGRTDAAALANAALARYHDWEGELRTVTSSLFGQLLARHGIELISFAGLQ